MKKAIRSLLSCLLTAALVLGAVVPALGKSGYTSYETTEEIRSNGYDGEYFVLRTPSDEPRTLYVEGVCASDTKMILIRAMNEAEGSVMRVFVRPESDGSFAVRIDTTEGSYDFPTATAGTVVKDENGGQTGSRCYGTIPGYRPNPALNGLYRVTITRGVTDEVADSVYDGGWSSEDNPLSGSLGSACKELVVEMRSNDPQVVDYAAIRAHNAQLRAQDAELTEDSPAYLRCTDAYMKDCEWLMDTGGVTHPLDEQKVAFIRSAADEITAGAQSDYEKALRIYEFVSDSFYYDNYAYNNDVQQQYCNPYDNLYRLLESAEGPNSSDGRVATVCNGFSILVAALARAEGIPARIARGYHITGSKVVWADELSFTDTVSHYWAELYVDGRWMVVDATRGSQKEWRRTGFDDDSDEAWVTGDVRSYVGFDITEQTLANNYFYIDFYNEYKDLLPPRITEVDTATGNLILRWDSVEGADSYYIYRGESDDDIHYLCSVRTGQFIACSEQPGVAAYYRVRPVGEGSEGTFSNLQVVVLTEEECALRTDGAITGQPRSVSAVPGESVTFSVEAAGDYLSYCWQVCLPGSDEWNNSGAEGAKTDTIRINATLARSGQRYRCVVKNGDYDKMISDEAELTVTQPIPVITLHPQDVTAALGETAAFTVAAEGDGLTYRWQYETEDGWANSGIDGWDTPTLSVPVIASRNGQRYRCAVTAAGGGKAYSDPATLLVSTVVTAQPSDVTAAVGKTAKLTVKASGVDLSYRWQYYNGSKWCYSGLAGCQTNTISVPVTVARNGQQYRCVITDANGVKTCSESAKVLVKTVVDTQPAGASGHVGEKVRFSVGATGAGLTYQWQYSNGGGWKNSSQTGNKTAALTVPVTAARNGQQYRCVITDANGVQTESDAAALTVKTDIITQPAAQSLPIGQTARFAVEATGAGLTYQWQYYTSAGWKNSSLSGNKTAVLRVRVTAARNGQKYRCVITDANGKTAYSSWARLTVQTVITAQPQDAAANQGETVTFTVAAAGANLRYQWQYRTSAAGEWKNSGAEGAKTASLRIAASTSRNGYQYRCVITDANGVKTSSDPATLTVT